MFYVLMLVLILILVLLDTKKPKNFPKGPFWFPIFGSAVKIEKCRRECGMLIRGVEKIARSSPETRDVIGFKVGKDKVVFAVSTDSIIEMCSNPDLDGRPYGIFYETRTWNLRRGIALTDGGSCDLELYFCSIVIYKLSIFAFRVLENSTSLHNTTFEAVRLCQQRNDRNLSKRGRVLP